MYESEVKVYLFVALMVIAWLYIVGYVIAKNFNMYIMENSPNPNPDEQYAARFARYWPLWTIIAWWDSRGSISDDTDGD